MKKFIFILDVLNIMAGLKMGKRIEGVLYMDKNTGKLTFKAYNRQPRIWQKDKLLCHLEHGWVKESVERIKVFESLPKRIGAARMIAALERETVVAANEIEERELFEEGAKTLW